MSIRRRHAMSRDARFVAHAEDGGAHVEGEDMAGSMGSRCVWQLIIVALAALVLNESPLALALDESPVPTAGASAGESVPPAPAPNPLKVESSGGSEEEVPLTPSVPNERNPKTTRHHVGGEIPDVEPTEARLLVKEDAWVFAKPTKWSKHILRARAGKFVDVTGTTRYYLQVRLKEGPVGYIDSSAVELVKPTDKIFVLTSDTPVLDHPSRWGKKVADVHKGRDVHIVGTALNYFKIRMKSGLEGYVSQSALQ